MWVQRDADSHQRPNSGLNLYNYLYIWDVSGSHSFSESSLLNFPLRPSPLKVLSLPVCWVGPLWGAAFLLSLFFSDFLAVAYLTSSLESEGVLISIWESSGSIVGVLNVADALVRGLVWHRIYSSYHLRVLEEGLVEEEFWHPLGQSWSWRFLLSS